MDGVTVSMSNEENVVEQLNSLVKLGPWLKAIIVGAFFFGLWLATLQFQVTTLTNQVGALEAAKVDRETKFDAWKETVIKETTELQAEIRGLREDVGELKEVLRGRK